MSEAESKPNNILLNPLAELSEAIHSNKWGISPTRTVIQADSAFPSTERDLKAVEEQSLKEGKTDPRVQATARIGLLDGVGQWVDVVLDQRGYTITNTFSPTLSAPVVQSTFESLEALLIALSPAYASAMTHEVNQKIDWGDLRPRAAWREEGEEAD